MTATHLFATILFLLPLISSSPLQPTPPQPNAQGLIPTPKNPLPHNTYDKNGILFCTHPSPAVSAPCTAADLAEAGTSLEDVHHVHETLERIREGMERRERAARAEVQLFEGGVKADVRLIEGDVARPEKVLWQDARQDLQRLGGGVEKGGTEVEGALRSSGQGTSGWGRVGKGTEIGGEAVRPGVLALRRL